MSAPDRLAALVRVEPPPELDRCVRQRLLAAVEAQPAASPRGGLSSRPDHDPSLGRVRDSAPVSLPLAERCVYVFGLLGYGAHALSAAARLFWRSVVG